MYICLQVVNGDAGQKLSGNRFICSNVGVDAAAFVTTIHAALAQTAGTFFLLLAGLTAHLHYDIRGVEPW